MGGVYTLTLCASRKIRGKDDGAYEIGKRPLQRLCYTDMNFSFQQCVGRVRKRRDHRLGWFVLFRSVQHSALCLFTNIVFSGGPVSAAQSCVGMGAFSWLVDGQRLKANK